jgi:hypothetical protein
MQQLMQRAGMSMNVANKIAAAFDQSPPSPKYTEGFRGAVSLPGGPF